MLLFNHFSYLSHLNLVMNIALDHIKRKDSRFKENSQTVDESRNLKKGGRLFSREGSWNFKPTSFLSRL